MGRLGLTLAALALVAGQGKAPADMLGFFDAARLNELCTASGALARDGRLVCLSYVTGAVDQLLARQAMGPPAERTICVPRDVTAEGVMQNVTAYAAWSRSSKGVSGADFVKSAMERAYPCDNNDSDVM